MILLKIEKMKYLKHGLLLTTLSLFLAASVFSDTGNPRAAQAADTSIPVINEYLNDIAYYDLQMGAVSVDMYLYLGWASNEIEDMRKASGIAIKHLDSIIKDVNALNAPKEAADVKTSFINAAEYLKEIYKNVEKKDETTIKKEFDAFNKNYSIYHAAWRKARFEDGGIKNIKEPEPIFSSKELSDNYSAALRLMKQKKYKEARDIFLSLKDKVNKKSSTYDYVVLNLSDVLGRMAYNFENVSSEDESSTPGDEEIIKYSEEILNKQYSPLFMDFFVRWRTLTQSYWNGVSNWSNIPNWEYNIKRKELINKIRHHLKDNSQDNWAKAQIVQLLAIDNILRGGPMGNDTLNYMGMLYPLPEDKKGISEESQNIPPSATIVE